MEPNIQEKFMKEAITAARKSAADGDYGIGAVITRGDEVISTGYETLKSANDPVNGHAEIDAIRRACQKLSKPYLEGCVLYSTHEPCPMCASASVWAKIDTIVFSVSREDMIEQMNKKTSNKFSWRQIDISCKEIVGKESPAPKVKIISGFLREEGLKLFDLTG